MARGSEGAFRRDRRDPQLRNQRIGSSAFTPSGFWAGYRRVEPVTKAHLPEAEQTFVRVLWRSAARVGGALARADDVCRTKLTHFVVYNRSSAFRRSSVLKLFRRSSRSNLCFLTF